jgi:hypothetical protein
MIYTKNMVVKIAYHHKHNHNIVYEEKDARNKVPNLHVCLHKVDILA